MSHLKSLSTPPARARQKTLAELIGAPALLPGESRADYEALAERARAAVGPQDLIEEIYLRDFVDYLWETRRLRQIKTLLLEVHSARGLTSVLEGEMLTDASRRDLVQSWHRRMPADRRRVRRALAQRGYDETVIYAETLREDLAIVEQIDALIARLEVRRDASLREIAHYRATLPRRLLDAEAALAQERLRALPADDEAAA